MKLFRGLTKAIGSAALAALVALAPVQSQAQTFANAFGFRNLIIGGDFSVNPYQRGTASVTGITSTATFGPDRWAGFGVAASSVTLARTATSATLAGFTQAMSLQRAAANASVVKICAVQELTTETVTQTQGQTMTLSWFGMAGANFSAASSQMEATVVTGTGADQGLASLIAATWTGQANTNDALYTLTSTGFQRYSVSFTMPSAATEAAVELCFTPVGTAGTTDSIIVTGIQLEQGALTQFEKRTAGQELALAQRFFYQITETAAVTPVATCSAVDTTHTNCLVPFPQPMRIVPTVTYATGFASPTSTTQATLGACSALANAATVASTAANVSAVLANCTATTIPAAGVASFLYSNGGTGKIIATAEMT